MEFHHRGGGGKKTQSAGVRLRGGTTEPLSLPGTHSLSLSLPPSLSLHTHTSVPSSPHQTTSNTSLSSPTSSPSPLLLLLPKLHIHHSYLRESETAAHPSRSFVTGSLKAAWGNCHHSKTEIQVSSPSFPPSPLFLSLSLSLSLPCGSVSMTQILVSITGFFPSVCPVPLPTLHARNNYIISPLINSQLWLLKHAARSSFIPLIFNKRTLSSPLSPDSQSLSTLWRTRLWSRDNVMERMRKCNTDKVQTGLFWSY